MREFISFGNRSKDLESVVSMTRGKDWNVSLEEIRLPVLWRRKKERLSAVFYAGMTEEEVVFIMYALLKNIG